MSNDTDKKIAKTEKKDSTTAAVKKKSGTKVILIISVCLVVASGAAIYFTKKELQGFKDHKHAELIALSSQASTLKQSISDLQEQQTSLIESINSLVEDQLGLQKNIATLYQGQNNSNQEWALAEVEYLLLIATHRLMLESDINTALVAIQAADNRLKSMPEPGLLTVRKQLMADMNTLRSVTPVDIPGLALYLADLVERIDTLPLKDPEIKAEQTSDSAAIMDETSAAWWKQLLSSVWQELKDVIIISHESEQAELSLLPQQTFFLRQNLRLQLESARYAVLRRDTELLHSSIDTINGWLTNYFAVSNNSVSNIIESLSQMRLLDLAPEIPDISSSLETVRAYIKASNTNENEIEENEEVSQ